MPSPSTVAYDVINGSDYLRPGTGPLLRQQGWTPKHLWVLDLQTGEGAFFRVGGYAKGDLDNHAIWVCPMFLPFLMWVYGQDLSDLDALPAVVTFTEDEARPRSSATAERDRQARRRGHRSDPFVSPEVPLEETVAALLAARGG